MNEQLWFQPNISQPNVNHVCGDLQQYNYIPPTMLPYAPYALTPLLVQSISPPIPVQQYTTKRKENQCKKKKKPRLISRKLNTKKKIEQKGEETLWDVVVKNKRIQTPEEIAARKAANTSSESSDKVNSLESLLDLTSPVEKSVNDMNLFELCTSNSTSETLKLGQDGSLFVEKPYQHAPDNICDMLLEGKVIIDEDYSKTKAVKQYDKAYKNTKAAQWSEKDLAQFLHAIQMFGLDFLMIQTLLPQFTIKQLRNKYKSEEKKANQRMENAITCKRPLKITQYENLHGPIDVSTHYQIEEKNVIDSPIASCDVTSVSENKDSIDDILSLFD